MRFFKNKTDITLFFHVVMKYRLDSPPVWAVVETWKERKRLKGLLDSPPVWAVVEIRDRVYF